MTAISNHPLPIWTLGDRLAKAREHAGLTQLEMAERLQIGRRSITRYETNSAPPRAIVLAYSTVTGIPMWWFDGPEDEASATTWYTAPLPLAA